MTSKHGQSHKVIAATEPFAAKTPLSGLFALAKEPSGEWLNSVSLLNLGGMMLGGHIIALGIKSCWLDADDALPTAVHALLLEGPDPATPCQMKVESLRDGQRLAHRSSRIKQANRDCARITTTLARPSLARTSSGYTHSATLPAVPEPETLPDRQTLISQLPASEGQLRRGILAGYPDLDIREIPCDPGQDGRGLFWVRVPEARTLCAIDQFCLLALITDYWFPLPTHKLPGARRTMGEDFVSISLDHALWFHTQPDCSDWILFDMRATGAAGGLSTLRGEAWSQSGQSLATFGQSSILLPSPFS